MIKHDNVLDMVGMREHVDGLDRLQDITTTLQYRNVTNLRLGIAGNIYDALRLQVQRCLQEFLACSRTWRIHE